MHRIILIILSIIATTTAIFFVINLDSKKETQEKPEIKEQVETSREIDLNTLASTSALSNSPNIELSTSSKENVNEPQSIASTSPISKSSVSSSVEGSTRFIASEIYKDWATVTRSVGFQFRFNQEGFYSAQGFREKGETISLFNASVFNFDLPIFTASYYFDKSSISFEDYYKDFRGGAKVSSIKSLNSIDIAGKQANHNEHILNTYNLSGIYDDYLVRTPSGANVMFSVLRSVSKSSADSKIDISSFKTLSLKTKDIISSIILDNFNYNSTIAPKEKFDGLTDSSKEKNRLDLLLKIRVEPYFEKSASYVGESSNSCGSDTSSLDFTIDENTFSFNVFDASGNRYGPMPISKTASEEIKEHEAREYWLREINDSLSIGSNKTIILRDLFDGKIEIIPANKSSNGYFSPSLNIRGGGGNCSVIDLELPFTGYSTYSLPITKKGDLGPIDADLDNDGIVDFKISLAHPMTKEKYGQIVAYLDLIGKSGLWKPSEGQIGGL